jgi:hypothetical protein
MRFIFIYSVFLFPFSPAFAQCLNPSGERGQVVFNESFDVLQGCTARGWMAFHEPGPDPCDPSESPVSGDVCADGSIYAGLSPDGSVAMYTTRADAGLFSWNNGTTDHVDTAMVNCTAAGASCDTGEANTAFLVGLGTTPSPAPYVAARHCDNLTAHGHSDWYLPARYELEVIYDNLVVGAPDVDANDITDDSGFNISGSFPAGWYWSSSERNVNGSWIQRFSDANQNGNYKNLGLSVRCVRR